METKLNFTQDNSYIKYKSNDISNFDKRYSHFEITSLPKYEWPDEFLQYKLRLVSKNGYSTSDSTWYFISIENAKKYCEEIIQKFIEKNLLTRKEKDYLKIVQENALELENVPKEYITDDLCFEALKSSIEAYKFIPEERIKKIFEYFSASGKLELMIKIPSLIKLADTSFFYGLDRIGKGYSTEYMIEQNPFVIEYLPESIVGPNHRELAVTINGLLLDLIVKKYDGYIDYYLCELAVEQNALAIQFVPKYLLSIDLITKAFIKDNSILRFVPDYYRYHVLEYNEKITNI